MAYDNKLFRHSWPEGNNSSRQSFAFSETRVKTKLKSEAVNVDRRSQTRPLRWTQVEKVAMWWCMPFKLVIWNGKVGML